MIGGDRGGVTCQRAGAGISLPSVFSFPRRRNLIMRLVLSGLLIALILSASGPAEAMRYQGTVLRAGAGFMFSGAQYSFDGAELVDGDTQIGAIAGVSTLWRWSRKSIWMLVLEADYVQKGYSGKRFLPDVDSGVQNVDALADFISVPVLGRVHFVEEDLTVYALFGPSLEFRIAHDEDPLLDEGKDFALAMNVGLGFEHALARTSALQLEFRYGLDLTDSWNGGDLYTVQSHRHQSLMVTGGLRF
jgi:hypothetical protein